MLPIKTPFKRLNYKVELINLMKERQYSEKQMQSLWTFIKLMLILPKKQETEFQEKLKNIIMEEPIYSQEDKEKLYDLAQVFHEAIHGKTFEERLEETQLQSALNFLKAGVSAQIVAFSLNLPLEKVLDIQAQLKVNEA